MSDGEGWIHWVAVFFPRVSNARRAPAAEHGRINTCGLGAVDVHPLPISTPPPTAAAAPDMTNVNGQQLVQPVPELAPEILANIIAQTGDRRTRAAYRLVNKWFARTVSLRLPEHLTPLVRYFAREIEHGQTEDEIQSALASTVSPSARLAMPLISRIVINRVDRLVDWNPAQLSWVFSLAGLKHVYLVGEWGWIKDARWERLANIVELKLLETYVPFSDTAVITAHTRKLRRLDLSHNPSQDPAALADALGGLPCLEHLDLGGSALGSEGVVSLGAALAAMPRLRFLGLFDTRMGNRKDAAAVAALGEGFSALAALEHLNLACAGSAAFAALVAAPKPELRTLFLGGNALDDDDMGDLALALESGLMPNLRHLELDFNKITAGGARQLLRALKHAPHFERLVLSRNDLGHTAALDLPLAAVPNLCYLDLSHSKLNAGHVRALPLSSVPRLHGLDLSHNMLGSEGVRSLNLALAAAPRLRELHIRCMGYGNDEVGRLALEQWPELRILDLSGTKARAQDDMCADLRTRLPRLQRLLI